MARKSSDLFSMLAARGGARSSRRLSGGWFRSVGAMFGGVLSGKARGEQKARAGLTGFSLAAALLGCLIGGYLLGDAFPMHAANRELQSGPGQTGQSGQTEAQRRSTEGSAPRQLDVSLSPTEEETKMGPVALMVAAYPEPQREGARSLAEQLRRHGVAKTRIHRHQGQNGQVTWFVLTYYQSDAEGRASQEKLRKMVAMPEFAAFEEQRKKEDWPRASRI